MEQYRHISLSEREEIFKHLSLGKSYREIGILLGRNHRSIAREVTRHGGRDEYRPSKANHAAKAMRSDSKVGLGKLDNPVLRSWVIRKLGSGWSPEQIAGRLQRISPSIYVSHETIYQCIYAKENKKLRLWELLRKRHRKRQLTYGRKGRKLQIPGRSMLDQRPEIINNRSVFVHWETDNMEGSKKTKAAVSVSIERKSRLTKLTKLDNQTAEEKSKSLLEQFKNLPPQLCKSITFDNGKENYHHQDISSRLRCNTYFCYPYHSWEKGSVENVIGLVREYLPKGEDLTNITQGELSWIAWQLNNRPRKILGYLTPSEVFRKESGWVT